jgi:hypothetical protein
MKRKLMAHCCSRLKEAIEKGSTLTGKKKFIRYDEQKRYYAIVCDSKRKIDLPLNYCPFCGTKFLPDLCDEFEKTLLNEYGPDYLTSFGTSIFETVPASKTLPAEFQTDEWWKKRGL